jgi:ComF family protein
MSFNKFTSYFSQLINYFLPPTCLFCAKPSSQSQSICAACHKDLPILADHCRQCAQVLPKALSFNANKICGACLKHPPPFERTHALFVYQPPIIRLIASFKFEHQLAPGAFLADCLIEKIKHDWYQHSPLPDLLLPVPLHPKRLCERGFNQALEIAKPLSKAFNIPIDINGVSRIKATIPQSGLSSDERQLNLKNAFHTTQTYHGKLVAIVDDVLTTGHTVTNLAHLLKRQGAKKIHVLAAARTNRVLK